ncbi:MAG TPA: ATPase, T2SS/T4P/T4SS family, partial [Planctomycetaceae bacterium]|nr:ATPase, T2SS/T4P/T4SS family [Planctomycetaceae bacterium]
AHASDIHLRPSADGLEISWRLDGVLSALTVWPKAWAANVIARMKVLAQLLTYRTELPQEGRLQTATPGVEMRLSTFPTLHGEKAVVRLFVASGQYRLLEDLALPADLAGSLRHLLQETAGVFVVSGPAGSGKTTTAYACLREMQRASNGARSLVTLEDPIEAELTGVAQTQVHRPAEFTYPLGLRSLLRQDPDVIFVGEIRDRETAATSFQAGLAGHLVLTTFHAGSAAEALVRLVDLGVEPYLLRAGLRGILCQRLLRQRCDCAAPAGCELCWHTGYRGRRVIAELLSPTAVRSGPAWSANLTEWQAAAVAGGMIPLETRAADAITAGWTTPEEVYRVLGTATDGLRQ